MAWRGGQELTLVDIIWGFVVIGLVTAASALSFARLDPRAGDHLHTNKQAPK